jgi:mono/diheme cytochrome c family protein
MKMYTRLLLSSGLAVMIACTGDRGRDDQMDGGDMDRGPEATGETQTTPGMSGETMPENVVLGKSIFEGKAAGGICYTCHGQDARGTQLAPNLTDEQWLNGEPTRENIEKVVRDGVEKPKEHQAPMPAFKNSLTDDQIEAVTEYVLWLSQHAAGQTQTGQTQYR